MQRKGLGSAAAIFDAAGRILLVKHTYGRLNWELPGGNSEPHESPTETVMREVREETGLEVTVKELTGYYYELAVDLVHFVFLCDAPKDAQPNPDQKEISDCAFWPVDGLPRPISDFTIRRVHDAIESKPLPLPTLIEERTWLE